MTKAGKLEKEFYSFKKEMETKIAALEDAIAKIPAKEVTLKSSKSIKKAPEKEIVIEAKDDIVASVAE